MGEVGAFWKEMDPGGKWRGPPEELHRHELPSTGATENKDSYYDRG